MLAPNGDVAIYDYDAAGNRTHLTDSSNNTTVFVYDDLNRLVSETNELAQTRTFEYDLNNNRTRAIDRNGRETIFRYDNINRLIEEEWIEAAATVALLEYGYNDAGDMDSASDANASYTYGYDKLGRRTAQTASVAGLLPVVALSSGYDLVGNRTSLSTTVGGVSDFLNTYTYDPLNRPDTIHQQFAGGNIVWPKRVHFDFDLANRPDEISFYASVAPTNPANVATYGFDAVGRLTSLSHVTHLSGTIDYNWQYDQADRITQFVSPDGTQNYTYDDAGQLTSASLTSETYVYGADGNRLGNVTGADNRLASDGVYDFAYDAEGNLTRRTTIATGAVRTFDYDHRNRLIAVRDYDGDPSTGILLQAVEYAYDVFNRRVSRREDSDGNGGVDVHETYVYDDDDVIFDFLGDGATNEPARRYLHGQAVDQVLAQENTAEFPTSVDRVFFFAGDNQQTTRDILNRTGAVKQHYQYGAFGQLLAGDASLTRYLYTAREFDAATDLQYNRNRWYDASIGRWISQDPIGFDAGDANLYRYVENNSTNNTDPEGLDFIAVADRPVRGTGGFAFHYSLQYWESDVSCPIPERRKFRGRTVPNQGIPIEQVPATVGDPEARKKFAVELLADASGWRALVDTNPIDRALRGNVRNVWVSVITHSDSATRLVPIHDGATEADWRRIMALADGYRFAEHPANQPWGSKPLPRDHQFTNWPDSHYDPVGTNSNVFVRWLVRSAGMTMIELRGPHPPANDFTPSRNDPDLLSKAPFRP